MKKVFFIIVILTMVLCSCDNNFADIMLRTYDDPVDEAPVVDSYREEETIYVGWNKDEGADEYILLRALDDSTYLSFSEIYRGNALLYKDTNLNVENRYLYKLYKVRGNQVFKSNKIGYGYVSRKRRDNLNNHTKENAAWLQYSIDNLTVYHEKYYNGYVNYEEDYFKVRVPARSIAYIMVEQIDPMPSSGATRKSIEWLIDSQPYDNVGERFSLRNESMDEKFIYFRIRAESPTGLANVNNITYKIKIVNITPINQ